MNLQEDLDRAKAKDAIVEALLNAAIYGTGIAKITVDEEIGKKLGGSAIPDTLTTDTVVYEEDMTTVRIDPLTPKEFAIDPSATSIDEALGVAQVVIKPKYEIIEGIKNGIYEDKPVGSYDKMDLGFEEENDTSDDDKVKITEYWG